MRFTDEHIYLCKFMLKLRKRVSGHETPILIDVNELDNKKIRDKQVLFSLLNELKFELMPVEGESSRKAVVESYEETENGIITVLGTSTEKLIAFIKKITPMNGDGFTLPTMDRLPQAQSWERLKITVNELRESYVYFQDPSDRWSSQYKIDFEQLGLHGRKSNVPGVLWDVFERMAKQNGKFEYSLSGEDSARKNKSELTKRLKARFNLVEDPFKRIEARIYKTKFELRYDQDFTLNRGE